MSTVQTRKKPPAKPPVQYPRSKKPRGRRTWLVAGAAALVAAVGLAAIVALRGGDAETSSAGGLPATPDYHSLLVSANDPSTLVLGTHEGLFRSSDGGRNWSRASLGGQDAMNLARANGGTVWAAGHDVLARSSDGGETWSDVRPAGLPYLDVHGFAVDPRDPRTLYAAIAGQGLFRSTDGGDSFSLVSSEVGPGVMALTVTAGGTILAGDMQQGLFASSDGGKTWKLTLEAGLMGLAVSPSRPERILAAGPGILLSKDGGRTWTQQLALEQGAGPVAWAASDSGRAYAVGFDRRLYATDDGGETWSAVGTEG